MCCPKCGSSESIDLGVFGNEKQAVCKACGNQYSNGRINQEEKGELERGEIKEMRG